MVKAIRVRLDRWETCKEAASSIRMKVFVKEQGIPVEIEMDDTDADCLHAVAVDLAGRFIGTARLLPDGYIGRMAVLPKYRGKGVGSALMLALLEASFQRGDQENMISAQTHAASFYARFGFEPEGDEYHEAGIAHISMRRPQSGT